jgi:type I restriction enzyme S subunit
MKYKLEDIVEVTMGQSPKSQYYNAEGKGTPFLQGNRTFGFKRPIFDTYTTLVTKEAKAGDVIMSVRAPVGDINITPIDMCLGRGVCSLRMKNGNQEFLYYMMKYYMSQLLNKENGTVFGSVNRNDINGLEVDIPEDIERQKKIARYLTMIDDKIELNTDINNNLEEQLSALFVNMFGHFIDSLDNSDIKLGDLIESVDNRGKTPPLSDEPTDYPIIDVRALSGNSRIIDYTNCTKYVSKETYNNWFRSGHPKEYDILISTVGSLAEMKIFLGTTGCIAQNVVGFRTKGISSLYLYQYLNYIKNDLVAYNIGSVQPSIKVTHIIKHSIYVASKEDIEIFDSIARDITKKIFANCQESEALKQMRDTLLPKLMSGELDVSNIEI